MNGKELYQRACDYHSPTISRISIFSERGFAISFDDELFFGDEGAAGGDLLDDVFIEF